MLKKMVLLAVVGFVAVTALAGTKIGSYIRSEISEARKAAEDNIPPEKEVARLRSELKMLDKDMMAVVNQLAKERVEVNQLQDKVTEVAGKQEGAKALLKDRAAAIKNAEANAKKDSPLTVTFGTRKLSVDAAKEELSEGVKRFEANQRTLATLEQTLAVRTRVRDTLEKQLETLKNQKTELATAIDGLEAEINAVKLQQMESKYQTDDTRLAKIKDDMRKLKTRLDVEREKLKLMPAALEPTTPPASSNKSVDEIIAPLNGNAKPAAQVPHAD
jgi:chromosome segregation ATPase